MSDTYIPGTCNIGKGEIRRRQMVALIGVVISAISLIGMATTNATPQARLGIFIPLSVAAIGFVQSRRKFCLAYGFMGTFNFGKLGELSKVSSKESRTVDRKTALAILAQALEIGRAHV